MKQTFTLLAVLCMAAAGYAQPYTEIQKPTACAIALNTTSVHNNAKTTAIKQRLIKRVLGRPEGPTFDSAIYSYDFGRGSEFDFDYLVYNDGLAPQLGNHKAVWFDSMDNTVGQWYSGIEYAGSAPMSQVTYSPAMIGWAFWTYNHAGQAIQCLKKGCYTAGWLTDRINYFQYDAYGRLIKDSSVKYSMGIDIGPERNVVYQYNSQGLVDTITYSEYKSFENKWVLKDRYIFGYTGTEVTSTIYQNYIGLYWIDQWKTEMTYVSGQKVSELYYDWDGTNWELGTEEYRHLNANNLPDSVFLRNIYLPDTMIKKISYTSFGNPDTTWTYRSYSNDLLVERFWYEEYDPTAIKDVSTAKTLTVYPNPAKDQLHIATSDMKPGNINYTVTNALSQSVLMGSNKHGSGEMTVDIHPLSPGMYWLQLQDAKGQWYKATFSKVQ